jgi:hypothetical protein
VLVVLVANWLFRFIGGREGLNDRKPFYLPSNATNSPKIQFNLPDLTQEAEYAIQFAIIDSNIDPSFISFDSYVMQPNAKIGEHYKQIFANCRWNTEPNSTDCNDDVNAALDASYGHFFDPNWLNKRENTNKSIAVDWEDIESIVLDDQLFNAVKYFSVVNPDAKRTPEKTGLSSYFLNSIIENKKNGASENVFKQLKNSFYAIIRPRFLANTISNIYWKSQQELTNTDKNKNGSIIYVLGTHYTLLKNLQLNIKTDLSGSPIFSSTPGTTSIFTVDSIVLYQTVAILLEYAKFINKFSQSTNILSPSPVKTGLTQFNSGFQKYLDRAQSASFPSVLVFFCNNLPDKSNTVPMDAINQMFNVEEE